MLERYINDGFRRFVWSDSKAHRGDNDDPNNVVGNRQDKPKYAPVIGGSQRFRGSTSAKADLSSNQQLSKRNGNGKPKHKVLFEH